MKKTNMISFWRVIYTYVIILLHLFNQYGHVTGLAVGVEFFFIVSGWLLAVDLDKKNRTPYEYTWHRILRLYPEYFFAFIVSAVFYVHFHNYTIVDSMKWFADKGYRELLMIHFWPWADSGAIANIVTWYISVLIIAGLLLYSMGKRCPNALKEIIIPITLVLFLSYTYLNVGDITSDRLDFGGLLHMKFFRGFSEMGLGMLLYELSKKNILECRWKKMIELLGFVSLALVIVFGYIVGGVYTYMYLWLVAIGVFISFDVELNHFNRVIVFFDKISYTLFLNHIIFRSYIIPHFFSELTGQCIVIYLLLVTLFSIIMYYLRFWAEIIVKKLL